MREQYCALEQSAMPMAHAAATTRRVRRPHDAARWQTSVPASPLALERGTSAVVRAQGEGRQSCASRRRAVDARQARRCSLTECPYGQLAAGLRRRDRRDNVAVCASILRGRMLFGVPSAKTRALLDSSGSLSATGVPRVRDAPLPLASRNRPLPVLPPPASDQSCPLANVPRRALPALCVGAERNRAKYPPPHLPTRARQVARHTSVRL